MGGPQGVCNASLDPRVLGFFFFLFFSIFLVGPVSDELCHVVVPTKVLGDPTALTSARRRGWQDWVGPGGGGGIEAWTETWPVAAVARG